MTTAPTQVHIDAGVKRETSELFAKLGLDMSGAINLFLHQCILREGIPFAVEMPQYSQHTLNAMEEARRISKDSAIRGYNSMSDLKAALEADV